MEGDPHWYAGGSYSVYTHNRFSPLGDNDLYDGSYPYMRREYDNLTVHLTTIIRVTLAPRMVGIFPEKSKAEKGVQNQERHPSGAEEPKEKEQLGHPGYF